MIHPLEPRRLLSVSDTDLTFGDRGIAVADVGREAAIAAAAAQPDGKIVVAGRVGSNAMLARFTLDGALDPPFAAGDRAATRFNADGTLDTTYTTGRHRAGANAGAGPTATCSTSMAT